MKKLLAGIIAVGAAAFAVWFFGSKYLGETLVWQIVVGLLIALVVFSLVLLVWWIMGLLRAARIRSDLQNPAAPTDRAQLTVLRATLKQLALHLRGIHEPPGRIRSALHSLPWWMVIGGEGHGKTALAELADPSRTEVLPHGASPEDVTGDHRLRLFTARGRGVFLEVPAVLSQRSRSFWLAVLRTLRRVRRRQPIDGIVIAASLPELLRLAESDRATLAQTLGASVRDICVLMRVRVPIHVVLTKFDLVPGFAEVLGKLEAPERPFGCETTGTPTEARRLVQEALRAQGEWVRQRSLGLLANVEDRGAQARAFMFVRQLRESATILEHFLGHLFRGEWVRDVQPPLFGVYFTSVGTRPSIESAGDWLIDREAQRLGVARKARQGVDAKQPDQTPSFGSDLFRTVLVRERRFAARMPRYRRWQLGWRYTAAAAAVTLSVVGAFSIRDSADANLDLLQRTGSAARAAGAAIDAVGARTQVRSTIPVAVLTELQAVTTQWQDYSTEGPPSGMRWALFRRDNEERVARLFRHAIHEGVLRGLTQQLKEELEQFADRYAPADTKPATKERGRFLRRLRTYLLLTPTSPATTGEPRATDVAEWGYFKDDLAGMWISVGHDKDTPAKTSLLDTYRVISGDFSLARDAEVVRKARDVLNRVDPDDVVIDRIVAGVSEPMLDLPKITTAANISARERTIRGAFTLGGSQQVFRAVRNEIAAAEGDLWVLGLTDDGALRKVRCAGLFSRYYDLYQQEWHGFINALKLSTPHGDITGDASIKIFDELSSKKPISRVFEAIASHTGQLDPSPSVLGKLASDVCAEAIAIRTPRYLQAKDVKDYFAPFVGFGIVEAGGKSKIDAYHDWLSQIHIALVEAQRNQDDSALADIVSKAWSDTNRDIQQDVDDPWRLRLEQFLLPPLEGAQRKVQGGQDGRAWDHWCREIVDPMEAQFAQRYPFTSTNNDVPLKALRDFFGPDGTIYNFRKEKLEGYIQMVGSRADAIPRDKGAAAIDPRVLKFFSRAEELRTVLFPDGQLRVDFSVTLRCHPSVNDVRFTVDGQSASFQCAAGNNLKPMHWPGDGKDGTKLEITGKNMPRESLVKLADWAFWRFLEDENVSVTRRADDAVVEFTSLRAGKVKVMELGLLPVNGVSVLFGTNNELMSLFRARGLLPPPRQLFQGGKSCP